MRLVIIYWKQFAHNRSSCQNHLDFFAKCSHVSWTQEKSSCASIVGNIKYTVKVCSQAMNAGVIPWSIQAKAISYCYMVQGKTTRWQLHRRLARRFLKCHLPLSYCWWKIAQDYSSITQLLQAVPTFQNPARPESYAPPEQRTETNTD